MPAEGRRRIGEFVATADDCRRLTLVVWQRFIRDDSTGSSIDTLRELKTVDGRTVNWVSDTEFLLLDPLEEILLHGNVPAALRLPSPGIDDAR